MIIRKIYSSINKISILTKKLCYGANFQVGRINIRDKLKIWFEKGAHLYIGDGCFFNSGCCITCLHSIEIGKNCIFGEGVKIYDHNHKFQDVNRLIKDQGFSYGNVCIGEDCWIGSNVVILKNARIGSHVIIGAGCVINENISDNTLVRCDRHIECEEIERTKSL